MPVPTRRQFRYDDTEKWVEKFTRGFSGDKTFASNHTIDSTDGFYNGTLTATAGALTGTTDLADGTYNLPCKIVQTQGTGANDDPNWEFNVLKSVSGGVATFKYIFTRNYYAGAQFITGNDYRNVTINPGVILYGPTWNGSKGGELVIFSKETFNNGLGGALELRGRGFRGGDAIGGTAKGRRGEGYPGRGNDQVTSASNGQGGGAGGYSNNGPWNQGNGGGGGAHLGTPGTSGYGTGGGNNSDGPAGPHGDTVGNAELTIMQMGGPGGSGGAEGSGNSGKGADAPANLTIVSKVITLGIVWGDGSEGEGHRPFHKASGGSSAGFACLLKCYRATVSSSASAIGGPRVFNDESVPYAAGDADGGAGDNGRFAIDYLHSVTGDTNPGANTRQDTTLRERAGGSAVLAALLAV